MEKYNQQIGSIIKDAFRTWTIRSVPGLRLCSKADHLWEEGVKNALFSLLCRKLNVLTVRYHQ